MDTKRLIGRCLRRQNKNRKKGMFLAMIVQNAILVKFYSNSRVVMDKSLLDRHSIQHENGFSFLLIIAMIISVLGNLPLSIRT